MCFGPERSYSVPFDEGPRSLPRSASPFQVPIGVRRSMDTKRPTVHCGTCNHHRNKQILLLSLRLERTTTRGGTPSTYRQSKSVRPRKLINNFNVIPG
jgi:hypothetical protein